MAGMIFPYAPNRRIMAHNPDSTDWTEVTLPTDVTAGSMNVSVVMTSTDDAGTADGSLFLVNFDQTAQPSIGFPVRAGTTFVTTLNKNIWIKLTAATDKVSLLFLW
jgi:hypothetical protein